jgi:condensation domain-containing protein
MRESHDVHTAVIADSSRATNEPLGRPRLAHSNRFARIPSAISPRAEGDESIPLSYSQERLWFLDQLGLVGVAYNVSLALRLVGDLDASALERAFVDLVSRHESLRTRFVLDRGTPHQVIDPPGRFESRRADLRHLSLEDREGKLRECVRAEQLHEYRLSARGVHRTSSCVPFSKHARDPA